MRELIRMIFLWIFKRSEYCRLRRAEIVKSTLEQRALEYRREHHCSDKEFPFAMRVVSKAFAKDFMSANIWFEVNIDNITVYECYHFEFCVEENMLFSHPSKTYVDSALEACRHISGDNMFVPIDSEIKDPKINLNLMYYRAYNLYERFKSVIENFYIYGEHFIVRYNLGYETKVFEAHFKNNNLKKKLNGAMAFRDIEANLEILVTNVNMFYSSFGSNLKLSFEVFKLWDAAGLHHFRLDINGYVIVDTSKCEKLEKIYEGLGSNEIETKLKNLISEDLVKMKIDNKVYICSSNVRLQNGVMEWRPLFPRSADETILTSGVVILERFHKR